MAVSSTGECSDKVQQLLAICTLLATPNDDHLYLIGNPFWNLIAAPPPVLGFVLALILRKNTHFRRKKSFSDPFDDWHTYVIDQGENFGG